MLIRKQNHIGETIRDCCTSRGRALIAVVDVSCHRRRRRRHELKSAQLEASGGTLKWRINIEGTAYREGLERHSQVSSSLL